MAEIKFPFKPNKKVVTAFRRVKKQRRAIRMFIEQIIDMCNEEDPFEVLQEEHSEFKEISNKLTFNVNTEKIEIKAE